MIIINNFSHSLCTSTVIALTIKNLFYKLVYYFLNKTSFIKYSLKYFIYSKKKKLYGFWGFSQYVSYMYIHLKTVDAKGFSALVIEMSKLNI